MSWRNDTTGAISARLPPVSGTSSERSLSTGIYSQTPTRCKLGAPQLLVHPQTWWVWVFPYFGDKSGVTPGRGEQGPRREGYLEDGCTSKNYFSGVISFSFPLHERNFWEVNWEVFTLRQHPWGSWVGRRKACSLPPSLPHIILWQSG